MKVLIDIIHGNKNMNSMMHAMDVFENSKQLAKCERFVVEGEPDLERLTTRTKEAFEEAGSNVVFVSIRQVGPTLTNEYDRYIKSGVSALSDGHNWGLFKDCLEQIGYEVETNQYMRVEKVKLTW